MIFCFGFVLFLFVCWLVFGFSFSFWSQATGYLLLRQEIDDGFGGEENIIRVWPC